MPKLTATVILVISLFMAVLAIAGSLKDAKEAYDRGDHTTAVRLYMPLAEQGDAEAQHAIGYMYRTGEGVPKDLVKAYMWLTLAISQFHELDTARRTLVESNRILVATSMTPEQIAEAQKLAQVWITKKEQCRTGSGVNC